MFGEYFYNSTIRNITAAFGSLFNEIYVARKKSDGTLTSQTRVPIAYGPRQKFLERIEKRSNLEDEKVAIKLPRMSFKADAPVFDQERVKAKNFYNIFEHDDKVYKLWNPTPYILPFELSIYTENKNEMLQIVEQIIPYFAPSLGMTIKSVNGINTIKDTVSVVLRSISDEDSFEGTFEERRIQIYTLAFDVKFYLYRAITTEENEIKTIKNVIVNLRNKDDEGLIQKTTTSVNPQSAERDDTYIIEVTDDFGFE